MRSTRILRRLQCLYRWSGFSVLTSSSKLFTTEMTNTLQLLKIVKERLHGISQPTVWILEIFVDSRLSPVCLRWWVLMMINYISSGSSDTNQNQECLLSTEYWPVSPWLTHCHQLFHYCVMWASRLTNHRSALCHVTNHSSALCNVSITREKPRSNSFSSSHQCSRC